MQLKIQKGRTYPMKEKCAQTVGISIRYHVAPRFIPRNPSVT